MTAIEFVDRRTDDEGDDVLEIGLNGRRVILFAERGTNRLGFAIATLPPTVAYSAGYVTFNDVREILDVIERGLR